jgi:hypothetical protein
VAGCYEVLFGTAELLPDADRAHGWFLSVGGVPQSYLQLDDLSHLEFEYVRLIGDVLDLTGEPAEPLTVLHLGGGACTLPRYVATTRPGSTQLVIEADAPLAELVRVELGTAGFTLRVAEARAALERLGEATSDVVVADVFAGADLPRHLTTAEYLREVRRVLRPGGTYVANVADGGGLGFVRSQVATLRAAFGHVVLLGEPGVLRGRRFGNVVLVASDGPLPELGLRRRAARAIGTARVVAGDDLRDFVGGAAVVTDATAAAAPSPPAGIFVR